MKRSDFSPRERVLMGIAVVMGALILGFTVAGLIQEGIDAKPKYHNGVRR